MPSNEEMKATMRLYVERVNAGDLDGILALFADDATVEDPVGSGIHTDPEGVRAFYALAIANGAKLAIVAPQRGSAGDMAAMVLDVDVTPPGSPKMRVGVIETMRFNEAGKIVEMRAYWGPEDMTLSVA